MSLSRNKLKMIACLSMLIDHTGAVLFPQVLFLRIIGRLAFPIFAYFLVEGFFHTRNIKKYASRLFIFACLSEVPFDLAFYGKVLDLSHQNIFFTLFIGLVALWLYGSNQPKAVKVLGEISIFILTFLLRVDYGIGGILVIFVFYKFYENFPKMCLSYAGVMLLFYGIVEYASIFALGLIYIYDHKKSQGHSFLFYGFYPLHLLALFIIKRYIVM